MNDADEEVEMTLVNPPQVATHTLMASVSVYTAEQWTEVYELLCHLTSHLGPRFPRASVSSYDLRDEDGVEENTEYFDEWTVHRAQMAMRKAGLSEERTIAVLNELSNAGILLRERPR